MDEMTLLVSFTFFSQSHGNVGATKCPFKATFKRRVEVFHGHPQKHQQRAANPQKTQLAAFLGFNRNTKMQMSEK